MSEIATVVLKDRSQITIPSKMRKEMDLQVGEELLIFESEGRLTIVPKIKDPIGMAGFLGKDSTKDLKGFIMKHRRVLE